MKLITEHSVAWEKKEQLEEKKRKKISVLYMIVNTKQIFSSF